MPFRSTSFIKPALAVSLLTVGSSSGATWQDDGVAATEPTRPPAGTRYRSVTSLNQKADGFVPQLRGGEIAHTPHWPASLYATFKDESGADSFCTAALVGPGAVLTAAHCVPVDAVLSFDFNGRSYLAACDMHPRWLQTRNQPRDASADFALCRVNKRVSGSQTVDVSSVVAPAGMRYEVVDISNPLSRYAHDRGTDVLLTGYGCIDDVVGAGTVDGKYRIGRNKIVETSVSATRTRPAQYYSPAERNNLITSADSQYTNLCPGDSGGPVFMRGADGLPHPNRRVIGVNSRVFYANTPQGASRRYEASLLSATGGPDFPSWARTWAERGPRVEVCGVNSTAGFCRQPT